MPRVSHKMLLEGLSGHSAELICVSAACRAYLPLPPHWLKYLSLRGEPYRPRQVAFCPRCSNFLVAVRTAGRVHGPLIRLNSKIKRMLIGLARNWHKGFRRVFPEASDA